MFKFQNTKAGTPYEDGFFRVNIQFPQDYPFKPPKVEFVTKIFNTGIHENGNIKLSILKNNWSPALTISKVLIAINDLFNEEEHFVECHAKLPLQLFTFNNSLSFMVLASYFTNKYAMDNSHNMNNNINGNCNYKGDHGKPVQAGPFPCCILDFEDEIKSIKIENTDKSNFYNHIMNNLNHFYDKNNGIVLKKIDDICSKYYYLPQMTMNEYKINIESKIFGIINNFIDVPNDIINKILEYSGLQKYYCGINKMVLWKNEKFQGFTNNEIESVYNHVKKEMESSSTSIHSFDGYVDINRGISYKDKTGYYNNEKFIKVVLRHYLKSRFCLFSARFYYNDKALQFSDKVNDIGFKSNGTSGTPDQIKIYSGFGCCSTSICK